MTDAGALTLAYLSSRPVDAARVLEQLESSSVGDFLATVPVRVAAGPLAAMTPWRAGRALACMDPAGAAALIEAIPPRRRPYCLRAIAPPLRAAILAQLPARRARALRRQLRFVATLVGAHMHVDTPAVREQTTVAEAIRLLRTTGTQSAVQLYVIDAAQRPLGVVPPAALFEVPGERPIDALVDRDCLPVAADMPLTQIDIADGWEGWPERPVVDSAGALVGTITLARIVAVRREPLGAISRGPEPGAVLLRAYGAAASGLGRTLLGLITGRGGNGV